jgi:hypothetical protein
VALVRRLLQLPGIGEQTAWLFVAEISKAGNNRVRSMATQIAWTWLIYQARVP